MNIFNRWFGKSDSRFQVLSEAVVAEPPSPWERLNIPLLGGVTEVGFSEKSDYLLVISFSGRGVIDLTTGEKVARDYEDYDPSWNDAPHLRAKGIGPIAEEMIPLCGLWGGGLRRFTEDGWQVNMVNTPNLEYIVYLGPPILTRGHPPPFHPTVIARVEEIRAFGFSPSGRHLVMVTNHYAAMWKRS